ncbi:type III secretion system effector protein [Lonsdalea iberica]|uniref:type III secretion system effector protein n=1 Tax=Lonsdalea iberica TaxID=1082703 RepID=UPI000C1C0EC7|nr:type III secretion system effector protein [Lonsdalea iberica]
MTWLPNQETPIKNLWPVSQTQKRTLDPAGALISQTHSAGNAAAADNGNVAFDSNSFFNLFDEIWAKLMLLAKELRDTMQYYNQKKQELGWGLEINALKQSFSAIDDSCSAAKLDAAGSIIGGFCSLGGVVYGEACGGGIAAEAGRFVGNAADQTAKGTFSALAANLKRSADEEKAIADLQDKGAQSYAKTLDDILAKAREIMQQMMEMGRSLVEVFSQALRSISR